MADKSHHQSLTELQQTLTDAKALMGNRFGNEHGHIEAVKHFRGGIYNITGYEIDSSDGGVRVQYSPIEMRYGVTFSRRMEEFFQSVSVQVGDGSVPDDIVPRFVGIQRHQRWETAYQTEERDREETNHY